MKDKLSYLTPKQTSDMPEHTLKVAIENVRGKLKKQGKQTTQHLIRERWQPYNVKSLRKSRMYSFSLNIVK